MTTAMPASAPDARPAVTYLVLAKAPVPGAVKTRLTPAFSDHEAAALAAAALLDTLDLVQQAVAGDEDETPGSARAVVALTGDLDDSAAPDALRGALRDFTVIEQQGDGLAARIAQAHRDAAGEFGATVQIGMDTPQVDASTLSRAGALVVSADGPDAALGPAEDGGWWLLALRRAGDARHLVGVAMSTPETGQLTRVALERAGLSVVLLPTLRDVDSPADVDLVAAVSPGTRFQALARTLGVRMEMS